MEEKEHLYVNLRQSFWNKQSLACPEFVLPAIQKCTAQFPRPLLCPGSCCRVKWRGHSFAYKSVLVGRQEKKVVQNPWNQGMKLTSEKDGLRSRGAGAEWTCTFKIGQGPQCEYRKWGKHRHVAATKESDFKQLPTFNSHQRAGSVRMPSF